MPTFDRTSLMTKITEAVLRERIRELEEIVLAVEWAKIGDPYCPECGYRKLFGEHAPTCQLSAACARIREEREKEKGKPS